MSKKTEELVDVLSLLTVLEMAELKTALEDKWGVKAAAAAAPAAAPAAAAAPAEAEATDFSVTLEGPIPADKKIAVIKVVREVTGLGLKEAKDTVDGAPKVIKASAPKAEAQDIQKKIEAAGAKASLKAV